MNNAANNHEAKYDVDGLYQGSPAQEHPSNNRLDEVIVATAPTYPPSYHDVPGTVPLGGGLESPPTYEEASDPNAPPPTYESLFGRVRQARRESSGFVEFLKKLMILFLGTVTCTIVLGVTMVVPITSIVIGSIHIDDCPVEPNIPIFLIVGGVFGLVKNLMDMRLRVKSRENEEEVLRQPPLANLISCFLTAWFIAGCVWVYRVYKPDFDKSDEDEYCHPTLYLYAFWLLNIVFIFMGLLMSCLCCVGGLSVTLADDSS